MYIIYIYVCVCVFLFKYATTYESAGHDLGLGANLKKFLSLWAATPWSTVLKGNPHLKKSWPVNLPSDQGNNYG